jgi:hypothetical protein
VCNRGRFFDIVEVWVENAYLVEVLDPEQLADYQRAMTIENWRRAFGVGDESPALQTLEGGPVAVCRT